MGVQRDYLSVQEGDLEVAWVPFEHVRNISVDTREARPSAIDVHALMERGTRCRNLSEALNDWHYCGVDIHVGYGNVLRGIMSEVSDEGILLVDDQELVYVPLRKLNWIRRCSKPHDIHESYEPSDRGECHDYNRAELEERMEMIPDTVLLEKQSFVSEVDAVVASSKKMEAAAEEQDLAIIELLHERRVEQSLSLDEARASSIGWGNIVASSKRQTKPKYKYRLSANAPSRRLRRVRRRAPRTYIKRYRTKPLTKVRKRGLIAMKRKLLAREGKLRVANISRRKNRKLTSQAIVRPSRLAEVHIPSSRIFVPSGYGH